MVPPTKGINELPARPEVLAASICSGDGRSGVSIVCTRSLMRICAVSAYGSRPSVGNDDIGVERAVGRMMKRRGRRRRGLMTMMEKMAFMMVVMMLSAIEMMKDRKWITDICAVQRICFQKKGFIASIFRTFSLLYHVHSPSFSLSFHLQRNSSCQLLICQSPYTGSSSHGAKT